MKLEDFIALGLSDEQAQAALDKYEASITGLKSKNEELLGKLTKTKEGKSATESELERLRQLEEKVRIDDAEAKSNYEQALKFVEERESKRANDLQAELESTNSFVRKLVVDNGLDAELDKAQVNPALKLAAKAILSSKLTVKDGQAVTEDGSTITDLVTGWSQTDEGKAFILASQNSGGGGQGSKGQGGNAAGKKFSEMSLAERNEIYKNDISEYRRLRDAEKTH